MAAINSEKINELLKEYQELPEFSGSELKSINQRGGFDGTPLHIAIYRGKLSEVKLLIEAGANFDSEGEYGERPLHVAINCGSAEITKTLLEAGANPMLLNYKGQTVFEFAKILGRVEELQELITVVSNKD